ncbi:DUF3618 domain-containing protein [Glaciihabitans sp. UYNi722]|uniref:DUF3618 domain-containing protein n=1 Tax=Glaciihabitans sp. UYNi722 TaxID=3156344 RepID=UPI00339B2CA2
MSNPDAIRADIERTRASLDYDVDALADKVNPSSIAHRQTEKIKGKVGSVRDTLMGSRDDLASSADDLKDKVQDKVQGNAIAVGLVVFGLGWLVSSLIPASEKEQDLAATVKEKAAPLTDAVTSAVKESAANLKEPAMDAAQSVKESATDAAASVKDDAQNAVADVKSSATDSAESVRDA